MKSYDPDHSPNPEHWLALDESQRISLVEEYHHATGIRLPNLKFHAIFHAIVENQIAENTDSVVRAMARLVSEGLTRHEVVHAIASVLAEHLHGLFDDKAEQKFSAAAYDAAVARLTARSWRGG